jgi:hypothetical protein
MAVLTDGEGGGVDFVTHLVATTDAVRSIVGLID